MKEIDIKELFTMFWSRRKIIYIIVGIALIIGAIYSFFFVEPKYQATTTIILAQSANNTTAVGEVDTITTTDLTLNQKLVSTYSELVKSKNILSDVIEQLKIDKTEDQLKKMITVTAVKDTDLIQIAVRDEDAQLATKIAAKIATVFIDKVAIGVYNINNVQVWDKAEVPTAPYNINHAKDLLIFAAIGVVVSAVYVFIANLLDTTVKTKEDIEEKIGLTVLSVIPVCDFDRTTRPSKGGKK